MIEPMLASTAHGSPPSGDQWAHEVKWDGMRVLAQARAGRLQLWSRSGRDVTARFPELQPLADLYDDLLLDGEVVAFDQGRPSFSTLIERINPTRSQPSIPRSAGAPVTYVVFDVLRVLGQDLTTQPWSSRRTVLEQLALDQGRTVGLVLVPPVHADGQALLAATEEQRLEGVISKRHTATYQPGNRSADWLKSAHRPTVSAVIGGWRPETGNATKLGAVLLGWPTADPGSEPHAPLRYLGRAGSGLAGKLGADLLAHLQHPSLQTSSNPFVLAGPDAIAQADLQQAIWVHPCLIVDVAALGGPPVSGKRLRQPSVRRLRLDLSGDQFWEEGRARPSPPGSSGGADPGHG